MKVPCYAELLARNDAPPGSSWDVFAKHDQLGTLNFLTPERAVAAAALVRRGRVFNLDYSLNAFQPSPTAWRTGAVHHMFSNNPNHRDDWLDSFYLQSTSQIDSLRHIRHPQYGFYGGVPDERIDVGVPDLGIQLMAEKGIVGRGVLLDAKRYFEARGEPLDPFTMRRFTPDDLDAIAASQRTALQPGDMLLLYTGWAETWVNTPPDLRPRRRGTPGIAQSQAMLAWIWDHQVALFAADNGGLEASPVDPDSGFISPDEPAPARGATHNGMLHRQMIALLGLAIGELWKLDALAEDCAADRRYEMLLTAKPLNVLGGVGSPPNALAIK